MAVLSDEVPTQHYFRASFQVGMPAELSMFVHVNSMSSAFRGFSQVHPVKLVPAHEGLVPRGGTHFDAEALEDSGGHTGGKTWEHNISTVSTYKNYSKVLNHKKDDYDHDHHCRRHHFHQWSFSGTIVIRHVFLHGVPTLVTSNVSSTQRLCIMCFRKVMKDSASAEEAFDTKPTCFMSHALCRVIP